MSYITNLGYFFNEDHSDDATRLMRGNLLGLDKLHTLYSIICPPKTLKRTPPKYFDTLADGLGPFSMLVNLYNQLLDRSIQDSMDTHRLGGAPERRGFFDAMQSSTLEDPSSPTRGSFHSEDFEMEDVDMTEAGSSPLRASPPAGPPVVGPAEEEPLRRTPTETLVADFMVTLLGGLASLVQPLSPRPLCIANSFEATFKFGPLRNTSQQQGEVQFRARVDGSIPFSTSLAGMLREAAIFEAKRAVRNESDGSIPVLAQQSMEHVAYIWKRHENDTTWKKRARTYHTFMVAQDHLHFHISVGTYNNKYLEYIFAPDTQPVLPAQSGIPFLTIQEFGPFGVEDEVELDGFLQIMLSFILWQLEQTKAKSTFKEALS
ncbi:hypothetical protein FQN49_005106 [Arthroderma sp. PD_2]|nr:hypothetical protein FQN49_005106 [Arthroderma sp. PD_2]